MELRRDRLQVDRQTDAYRVVNAEGDGLSGLIVDRYLLVIEFFSKAFFLRRKLLIHLLLEIFPAAKIHMKIDSVAAREGMALLSCQDRDSKR